MAQNWTLISEEMCVYLFKWEASQCTLSPWLLSRLIWTWSGLVWTWSGLVSSSFPLLSLKDKWQIRADNSWKTSSSSRGMISLSKTCDDNLIYIKSINESIFLFSYEMVDSACCLLLLLSGLSSSSLSLKHKWQMSSRLQQWGRRMIDGERNCDNDIT